MKYNIEVICDYICKKIPVPIRDFKSQPRLIGKVLLCCCFIQFFVILFKFFMILFTNLFFLVIRSFDVNKPGCEVDDLKGGVAGGSILRGVLKVCKDCFFFSFFF